MTIQRNKPCPCGSGIKYKKCCLAKRMTAEAEAADRRRREMAVLHQTYREGWLPDGSLTTDGQLAANKLARLAVAQVLTGEQP